MPITRVEFPESALIAKFATETVQTKYPDIRGPYNIPSWTVPILEEIYRRPNINGREVSVFLLKGVYLSRESLIFNSAGQLYSWSARQNSEEDVILGHRSIQDAVYYDTIERCDQRLVMCKRRSPFVFGHWMVDMLPLAYVAGQLLNTGPDRRFLLHRTMGPMDAIMIDTLARLGISEYDIRWSDNSPLWCRELIVVSGISEHGEYLTSTVRDCHDAVAEGCAGAGHERLFVRRGGQSRNLINEPDLANLAETKGFYIFDPNGCDITTQISVFKDAKIIVGAMGSSLTNLIYSIKCSCVTVLSPESMPDVFLWFLCQLRGINYIDMRCPHVGLEPQPPLPIWMRDFYLDPSVFNKILTEVIGML
ncbi:glycosyltransferase family 61 protein [Acidisphaera rubrifaciens]|uniref:glycosyltransferase family 61 protein n=1 Tax=Acidisphaera rubrifaciens TaxID=50715 RepID=UPI0011DDCF3E|nr:glycosyltransferase 61 family protein [Acidisphaera rubrifaciens]